MRRVRIFSLWLLGVVIVATALTLGAFYLTPSSVIARYAAEKIHSETGRELTLEGEIERSLFPRPGFGTGAIALANPDWAGPDPMISAQSLRIGVALRPLFEGRIVLEEVRLVEPTLRLVIDESGLSNYDAEPTSDRGSVAEAVSPESVVQALDEASQDETPADNSRSSDSALRLAAADLEVVGGVVMLDDRRTARRMHISEIGGQLSYPGADQPLHVTGQALINGRRATLKGAFDSLEAFLMNESLHADFAFEADGASIDFDGAIELDSVGDLRKAQGAVAFTLSDDKALTGWLRSALPPRLDLIGAVDMSGTLSATPEKLTVDLGGYADYNTVRTKVVAKAAAGDGWLAGETTGMAELSAANDYFVIGYDGKFGRTRESGVLLDGGYRARINDGDAFGRWIVDPSSTGEVTLLERFDLNGDIALLADRASASFKGTLDYNDRRVDITGELAGGSDWRAGGKVETSVAMATRDLATLEWRGDLVFDGGMPKVAGDVDLATSDLSALRFWLDEQPTPAFYKNFSVQSRVEGDSSGVRLDGAVLRLNDMEATATVEALMREQRPVLLTARFGGGPFDATPFLTGEAAGRDQAPPAPGAPWSDRPFSLSVLRAFDADIDVDIEGFRAAPLAVGPTRMRLLLRGGQLGATISEMTLYGGVVSGAAALDARAPTAHVSATARGTSLRMRPLLTALGQPDILYGDAEFDVTVAGSGRHLRALINSLDGEATGEIRNGALLVINFAARSLEFEAALLGARQEEAGVTPFDEVMATAKIRSGVLTNDDMTLTGPVISLKGQGNVDFGQKMLDYVVTPTRFGEISFLGIDRAIGSAYPVAIRGPFHEPTVDLDESRDLSGVVEESRRDFDR